VAALRIKVAALMTTDYLRRTLKPADGVEEIVLPGLCQADVEALVRHFGRPVRKGPKDLRDLPEFLGAPAEAYDPDGPHDLTILAEINDVHGLDDGAIVAQAARYRAAGADVIDLGCSPEHPIADLGRLVRLLRAEGHRVSIDTWNESEALSGDAAGAEYLLSLDSRNIALAGRIAAVPVVVPDAGRGVASLVRNVEEARGALPGVGMLMGTGNLTELSEADTTGITLLLAGIMSELEIRFALTTEVAGWAQGSVRELDCARRILHWGSGRGAVPRGYDGRLLTTRDAKVRRPGEAELRDLQSRVTDRNFRIDTDGEAVYVFNNERFVRTTDVRGVFPRLGIDGDASHAFYLGRELMKAEIARRLGKKYIQGEPLDWGYLSWTEEEGGAHARRT
jgi:dihydropteroate synthase